MLRFGSFLLRFYGKDCKTGLTKIVSHLTNSNPCKKRFSNRPIRFPGSNLDSGEITGNVIGSARSKDLTAWARGLSPTNTTRSDAPHRWRARRPLASRVMKAKPPSALGYLITANIRTLRVFPMQVLASSCLPQQILNFPSNLFTHFDEKTQEFTWIVKSHQKY